MIEPLKERRSGIYCLENIETGCMYVGSAINMANRSKSHIKKLISKSHYNEKMQTAFNISGGSLAFKVLEFCDDTVLHEREQYWIDCLDAVGTGYNICQVAGAPSWLGKKRKPFDDIWREKLTEAARRPRPSQSEAIKKHWENNRSPRVMLECIDCSKTKEVLASAAIKYAMPYRCRSCYLIAYSSGKLTVKTVVQVTCPDCGLVRDMKPSPRYARNNYYVRCLSCARKGDRNPGSKERLANLANNLSFIPGCS